MNIIEKQYKETLLNTSICYKCEENMKEVKTNINLLPFNILNLIVTQSLKYLVVRCPKCNLQGMHLYK